MICHGDQRAHVASKGTLNKHLFSEYTTLQGVTLQWKKIQRPASGNPLVTTNVQPTVTIGGINATVK
jgi:hypothetical protein